MRLWQEAASEFEPQTPELLVIRTNNLANGIPRPSSSVVGQRGEVWQNVILVHLYGVRNFKFAHQTHFVCTNHPWCSNSPLYLLKTFTLHAQVVFFAHSDCLCLSNQSQLGVHFC